MKKILLVIFLLILVGCSGAPAPVEEAPAAATGEESSDAVDCDSEIAVLEYQVEDLTETLAMLEAENETLKAQVGEAEEAAASSFMCEDTLENMKYSDPIGTIAIVEGWFATQPYVEKIQGTFSTTFWNDVNSRVHTIRYVSSEDGLTTTANFLLMFEEAGWQPGVLFMTESCWLDYPN